MTVIEKRNVSVCRGHELANALYILKKARVFIIYLEHRHFPKQNEKTEGFYFYSRVHKQQKPIL